MSDSTYASITAPDGSAQKNLIERTLEVANLAPSAVDYIVARGTGTALGDPIEVEALAEECHGSTAPLSIRGGGNNEEAFNGVEYVPPSMEQDGIDLITYCSNTDEEIRNLCVKLLKKSSKNSSNSSQLSECSSQLSELIVNLRQCIISLASAIEAFRQTYTVAWIQNTYPGHIVNCFIYIIVMY